MRVARRYLVYFLHSATILGIGYGLLTGRVGAGVIFGVVIGLCLTGGVVAFSIPGHREFGGALSPRASSTLDVAADPASVRLRVLEALEAMSARIVADDGSARITATTPMSLQSYRERITVELRPDASGTAVTVRSRPWHPWTLIDYGKGRRNVKFLVDAVTLRPLRLDADSEPAAAHA